MSVFRIERKTDYSIIPNGIFRDKRLSLKAKGLIAQMLSLPDDWNYTLQGLATINACGIDQIRSAVNELIETGYINRTRRRDERGRQYESIYTVFEEPQEVSTKEDLADFEFIEDDETDMCSRSDLEQLIAEDTAADAAEPLAELPPESLPDADYQAVRAAVRTQIDYDKIHHTAFPDERIDEIVELMTEVLASHRTQMPIGKELRSMQLVKEHYRLITNEHIMYLFECLSCIRTKITNMRAYLLTALYYLPQSYYTHIAADIAYYENMGWDSG